MAFLSRAAESQVTVNPAALADSSPARIVSRLRSNPAAISGILRQTFGPQSAAKIREIPDSLVAMALAPHTSPADAQTASGAVDALGDAGHSTEWGGGGVPVPGTLDRLISVDRGLPPSDLVRIHALAQMLMLPERDRAIPYLVGVASSTDPMAPHAMRELLTDADPGTRTVATTATERAQTTAAVRALWDRVKAQPRPGARGSAGPAGMPDAFTFAILEGFARQHGW